MPGFGLEREQELDFQGVYRIPPGGGDLSCSSTTSRSRTGSASRPTSRCSTSTTPSTRHIRVFDVGADHSALERPRVRRGHRRRRPREGRARRRDEARRARQRLRHRARAASGSSRPDGEHLGVIDVPESVGNLNWGDDDWQTLFIPASTSVYRVRMKVARQPARLHALGGASGLGSTRRPRP